MASFLTEFGGMFLQVVLRDVQGITLFLCLLCLDMMPRRVMGSFEHYTINGCSVVYLEHILNV
jgi:hypothetical protein